MVLECQRRHGKEFAGAAQLVEAGPRDPETGLTRHSQSVDVRFNSFFQVCEVAERVMGLIGDSVPEAPEEGRFLCVLFHNLRDYGDREGQADRQPES